MKVAHVITGLGLGGAETMLDKLLAHKSAGIDAEVIVLGDHAHYGPVIADRGIPVHALGMRPSAPNPLALFRLVRILRRMRPDVVQTWMYHADLLGGIAARLVGIRAVAWGVMQSNLSPSVNSVSTRLVIRACGLLSGIVPRRILTVSRAAIESHVDFGYQRPQFTVLPLGFDISQFRPDAAARATLRHELGLPEKSLVFGHVGRYDPQKNHAGLIEAFALVVKGGHDAHLLLVGTGIDNHNEELTALVARLDLTSRVWFLGRRDDVAATYAAFDVFVSSSIGEGFPNVIGEAMATGLPCVVTDVGDCAAVIGEFGLVVPAGDPVALARAMSSCHTLDRAAVGMFARTRVLEEFEIGVVTRRYESFHRELMQ